MKTVIAVCVLSAVASLCFAEAPAPPKKYATPAEVFAASQAARAAKDWSTWVDCLTPQSQSDGVALFIGFSLMDEATDGGTAPTPEQKKAKAEADALMAKFGLTDRKKKEGEDDKAYLERLAAQIKDKRGFLIEAMKFSMSPEDGQPQPKPELTDVKIDGDSASGKLVTKDPDGSSMSTDVDFKKIDGSWRIASMLNI